MKSRKRYGGKRKKGKLKGTIPPDYKCFEVISIKKTLGLGQVTPDIKIFQ
jgi:hypothetical protein